MRKAVQAAWRGSLANNWELEGPAESLKTYDGFSALGILCEIYRRMTGNGEWIGYPFLQQTFLEETTTPPAAVLEWADLQQEEIDFLKGRSWNEVKEWLKEQPQQSNLFLVSRVQDISLLPKLTYH